MNVVDRMQDTLGRNRLLPATPKQTIAALQLRLGIVLHEQPVPH
jgi:hypothetical protein